MKRIPKLLVLILIIVMIFAVSAPALADTGETAVTNALIDTIGGIVQVAVLALISMVAAWLRSKLKSDRLRNALGELEGAATATVGELQQVIVEGLKSANTDGKLTGKNINELGQKSLKLIKQRMSASAKSAIEAAGLDLQDLIRAKVEAAVTDMKKVA